MNAAISRPCVVWMLCLGLVLPGMGRAAEAPEVPGTQSDAPRRLLVDEQEQASRESPGAPRGLRILGEVGGGLVTSAAMGVALGGATGLLCLLALSVNPGGDYDGLTCLFLGLIGAGAGAGVGLPLGTWWAGELLGGNGSLLTSLGGAALGLVGGVLVLFGTASVTPRTDAGGVVRGATVPLFTLVGGILGYELSQQAPRGWASYGRVQPLVSFTASSTVIGLGGSF